MAIRRRYLREKVPEQAAKARLTEAMALIDVAGRPPPGALRDPESFSPAQQQIDAARTLFASVLPPGHVDTLLADWVQADLLRATGHAEPARQRQDELRQRMRAQSGWVVPQRLPMAY